MADVNVEFGATDQGLEETLKNVREAMAKLEEKQKTTAMGVEEFAKSMQEMKKLQGTEKYLNDLAGGAEKLGKEAKAAEDPVEKLREEFAKLPAPLQTAEAKLKGIQTELGELKDKAKTAEMTAEEFEATMKKIGQLEAAEKRLKSLGVEAKELGQESDKADGQVDELGKEIDQAGDKAQKAGTQVDKLADEEKKAGAAAKDMGEKSKWGYGEIAAGAAIAGAAAKAGMMVMDAAFAGVRKTIEGFGQALDLGGKLTDLQDQTGIAADKILIFQQAFKNAGLEADSFGQLINKMQDGLVSAQEGTGKVADALSKLGLKLSDLQGMTPDEQFRAIGKAISGIEDPALKTSLAMDIFGRSGGKLNALFADMDGAIAEAKSELGSLPDVMAKNAGLFDKVGDKISTIAGKFVSFAAGVIERVLPALESITTALARVDATKLGQELADFFTNGGQSMKGFQAAMDAIDGGDMATALKIIFKSLEEQAMTAGNQIYKAIVAAFEAIVEFIQNLFRESGPIMLVFEQLGKAISGSLKSNLFSAIGEIGKELPFLGEDFAKSMDEKSKEAADSVETAFGLMKFNGKLAVDEMKDGMAKIPDKFAEKMDKVPDLFTGIKDKQMEILELSAKQALANDESAKSVAGIAEKQKELADLIRQANEAEKITPELQEAIRSKIKEIVDLKKQAKGETTEIKKETEGAEKATEGLKDAQQGAADAAGKTKTEVKGVATEAGNAKTSMDGMTAAQEQAARAAQAAAEKQRKINEEKSASFAEELKFNAEIERARASGNKSLEKQLLNQQEYNKLLAEYSKYMPEEKAKLWAQEMANVKAPLATVAEQMEEIAKKKIDQPVLNFQEASKELKQELKDMAGVLGNDFSKIAFPDIAKAMGIDTFGASSREVLDMIKGRLDKIKESNIVIDMDTKDAEGKLDKFRGMGEKPIKISASASDFEKSWEKIEGKFNEQYKLQADTSDIKKDVEEFFKKPAELKVNTDVAEKKIKDLEKVEVQVKPEINQPKWNEELRKMESEVKVNAKGGDATANGGQGGEGGEGGLGGDAPEDKKPNKEDWQENILELRKSVDTIKSNWPVTLLVP